MKHSGLIVAECRACAYRISGRSQDAILKAAEDHARAIHPDIVAAMKLSGIEHPFVAFTTPLTVTP